jgi:hypothetical protein
MRLRYRGSANGLNRSCQQNEKALAKLLTCDAAEPANDIAEEDLQEALRQAKARIDTTRNRLSNPAPATKPGKGNPIFDALFAQAAPPPN